MQEPVWLSRLLIEAIHFEILQEYGGAYGIAQEELIKKALYSPKEKWMNGERDIFALAAGYAMGFVRERGYISGNTRLPLMALFVFLYINGWELEVSNSSATFTFQQLAQDKLVEGDFIQWIAAYSKPLFSTKLKKRRNS